jgi:hypothetical protein
MRLRAVTSSRLNRPLGWAKMSQFERLFGFE